MKETTVGVRQSVRHLQNEYDSGNKKPLEDLVRAWKGIKELPPTDENSFFVIGGYHGEPFHPRKAVDALSPTDTYMYWGGYCNHGNVLFPTWHRVYIHRLEKALQTIVPGVMMPFWDETSEETLRNGIPSILTQEKFELDGQTIDNPLRSFVLPEQLADDYWQDNEKGEKTPYYKPAGYETVRYPLSGLVGNPKDKAKTDAHNKRYQNKEQNTELLNKNILAWLHGGDPTSKNPDPTGTGIYSMFQSCLRAPNYTVFSNTTSAAAWNNANSSTVVALEDPHNDIHLSVGGFDAPALGGPGSTTGQVKGSNGDMGENNTAALDPIFYFHHCNVDRVFWLWQKQNGHTDDLDIIEDFAGTNSSDSQGPTPGIAPGTPLSLDTPLNPFNNPGTGKTFTSRDCVNIEKQLGYKYGPGSLDVLPPPAALRSEASAKKLMVRGIDRAQFQGSFVLSAWATVEGPDGKSMQYYLGHHSVLSRWSVSNCANCRTHLEVIAHFSLKGLTDDEVKRAKFSVKIQHRGEDLPRGFKFRLEVQG